MKGRRLAKVVLATRNQHKLIELRRMLAETGVELLGLDDVVPNGPELLEEEDSFEGNALSKARQAAALSALPTLADDSGLEVDALDGAPGIHSARFSGTHGNTAANTALLLEKLRKVPDDSRSARFRCVIALVDPESGGESIGEQFFEGVCEGRIAREPRGKGGFGYDPVFYLPQRGVTIAELADHEKDEISHRGRAVMRLKDYLLKTS